MPNMILIILIAIYFVFNFWWLRILLSDFLVFALYRLTPVSWTKLLVSKISLIELKYFLCPFFKIDLIIFQFHLSILGCWAFSFMVFFAFFYVGLFQSHIPNRGFAGLTQVNSDFFMFCFYFFSDIKLLNLELRGFSTYHGS